MLDLYSDIEHLRAGTRRCSEFEGESLMRKVTICPGEDGFWVAECPSLPGCASQGETKEQAILNIREAMDAYIAALEEDGLPIPEERFELLTVAV